MPCCGAKNPEVRKPPQQEDIYIPYTTIVLPPQS